MNKTKMALIEFVLIVLVCSGALSVCPPHWTPHGTSCYAILQQSSTWPNAMAICMAYGGYLAEITSSDENNFITELTRESHTVNPHWIGAADIISEGHWTWVHSGSLFDYTNWMPGQPNNYDGGSSVHGAHCAYMSTGGWKDGYCTYAGGLGICERSTLSDPVIGK